MVLLVRQIKQHAIVLAQNRAALGFLNAAKGLSYLHETTIHL